MSKILLLGNVKQDKSISMHIYLDDLCKNSGLKLEKVEPETKLNLNLFRYLVYPLIIPKNKDVYHIIDHSYANLALYTPSNKTIVTCHDLIPLVYPMVTNTLGRFLFNISMSGLKKAEYVIAISNNTKKDLINYLGIDEKKIKVIHYGINLKQFKSYSEKKKVVLRKKYGLVNKIVLLSVGTGFYKNNILILKALNELKKKYDNIVLLKIGAFLEKEKDYIKDNNLSDLIIRKENVKHGEIVEYYNCSDILVFPSLYEGFGRPPLEAMACKVPVITSNVSSLPEVVNDAAIKINPNNAKELVKSVNKILENSNYRKDLINKGLIQAKKFSWKKHLSEVKKLYKKLAESIKPKQF